LNSGCPGSATDRRAFNRRVLGPAFLAALVLVTGWGIGHSATAQPQGERETSRVGADRMVSRRINGKTIRFFYDNFFIDRDTLKAVADTAEDHVDEDYYLLFGHVVLTSSSAVLHCDRGLYRKGGGEADFSGNVRLVDGGLTGTSLRGEMRGSGRYVRLIDEARMVDPEFTVEADTIYRDRRTGVGIAMGHVRLEKAPGEHGPAPAPAGSVGATPADSLRGSAASDEDSTWTLDCRKAVFQSGGSESNFFGDVRMIDGEMIGTSRNAAARRGGDLFLLMGDALLVAPDYTIRADTISRNSVTNLGEATGNVRIVEPEAKNLVTGQHAVFDREAGTALVDSLPLLTSHEEGSDPIVSSSGRMRFFSGEDRAVMVDSVRIRQKDTRASADSAVIYGRERMILLGSPEVRLGDTNLLVGERIEFEYEAGDLRRMILQGKARLEDSTPDSLAAIYRGLPPLDVLSGDTISIDFEAGKIYRTQVVGEAASHYTPQDITDEIATNDVSGDTIVIHFREDKVRRVEVFGGVTGVYRFAKIAEMERRRKSPAPPDTLASAPADSAGLAVASLDTLAAGQYDFTGAVETVDYKGNKVVFKLDDESMEINGDGELNYGTMEHTAGHILLNTGSRELYSEDQPYLKDGDAVVGERMGYNFQYKTGAVQSGVTTMDGYYYVGDGIRRYPDGTMKIKGGHMTSCDQFPPHYHFWSNNMMMRKGDKVVAAPIVLKIGHVPVFALPFYYKSLKEGRQSGILFPTFDFGWSSREGRYIRDFGYYWATNEYMDFIVKGSYNEHQDLAYRISNRYVKRYSFNGSVDYSREIGLRGAGESSMWYLTWVHSHPTLFNDYKLRVDVRMSSSQLSSQDLTSSVRRNIVPGQMKSTAYVSCQWSFVGANLSASRDGRVNAEDDDPETNNLLYNLTLPSLKLDFRPFDLKAPLRGGQKGSILGNLLRSTHVKHSYNLNSDRQVNELTRITKYRATGNSSVTLQPAPLGIFKLNFSATAGQDWSRQTTTGTTWVSDTDSTGHYEDVYERIEDTRPNLRFSSGVGTKLYGLFPVHVGKLRAMRHTTELNASWNLTPAIADKQRHSTSVSLSWKNRLDLKYAAGDDSTKVKKLDGFIDWSLSTSYNPDKDQGDRWSDISSSLSIKPGQSRYLQLSVSNSINPTNLALKSTRFNYSLGFNGRLDLGVVQKEEDEDRRNSALDRLGTDKEKPQEKKPDPDDPFKNEKDSAFAGQGDDRFADAGRLGQTKKSGSDKDPTEGGRYLPFRLNSSISYSYTNSSQTKRANANFSVSANLTRLWEFSYQTSFDLDVGNPVSQRFTLTRDLHCWALEFNRNLSAVDSQFGFRLYLKAIPALKFVRGREGDFGSLAGGSGGNLF